MTDSSPVSPELFIGLVSATGTDLTFVSDILVEELAEVSYASDSTRLIELIHEIERWRELPHEPFDERLDAHMTAGTEFRECVGNDGVALLGVGHIRKQREHFTGHVDSECARRAYILRSLKNPGEVESLRSIYGQGFILLGVYSPEQARLTHLTRMIAESRHDFQIERFRSRAQFLMERDQEEGGRTGQNVRRTFHLADAFVTANDPTELRESLRRFVELLFGNSFHTPTRDEYGMFHAQAAAYRSSDLARQVGAAITTAGGDIIAVGTNEVPVAGGGQYWAGDKPDKRDFMLRYDSNDKHKRSMLADALERLRTGGWLSSEKSGSGAEELVKMAVDRELAPLRGAQVMNVIEFGRAVHAEMAALMDAARRGVPVHGATMYTTTFPCHLCARHVVAAGIKRVVYVEPYPKSLAAQLYPDSIQVDEAGSDSSLVSFVPFVGIAPRQYMNLFSKSERKDDEGRIITLDKSSAVPRCQGLAPSYLRNEKSKLDFLNQKMTEAGLRK